IVPFLGIDSTTFPSQARAMVSPWMPSGSVLTYMREHSPSSSYALEMLYDVINGLKYLFSKNIVHGDLCGRNILIDNKERARLTDFGLAVFMEDDKSKSSTRGGSIRWMAPELLRVGTPFKRTPASDIWAFGCVCCEIWTEGQNPFPHINQESAILFALADPQVLPYSHHPHDKRGNPMPVRLWELVQWCWKYDPAERVVAEAVSDILSEMVSHSSVALSSRSHPPTASGSQNVQPSQLLDYSSASADPSFSARSNPKGKGKEHESSQRRTTVLLGPLDIDGHPEEIAA
ncbi:kinase-like domain-containing protein, partial [Mycena leptocephala]